MNWSTDSVLNEHYSVLCPNVEEGNCLLKLVCHVTCSVKLGHPRAGGDPFSNQLRFAEFAKHHNGFPPARE
jgi:hypothetical protein